MEWFIKFFVTVDM
jgi:hypothetical protein